jgi:nitroimidazol reductase NimA-like FMN-containing flavoprotein (pyridoxamine 5'-phosphate oxidase superfamily)
MARGTAVFVEDPEEKMRARSILMKTQTGGDFTITEKLVKVVAIIRLDISEYTAKCRPMPKPRHTAEETGDEQ